MLPNVKIATHSQLRSFLANQTAATLAVPINDAGEIHAASLLYVHDDQPLRIYFVTAKTSEKYALLHTKQSIPAALVIGTEKGTPFTVQLRGTLQTLDPTINTEVVTRYYQKRGNKGDSLTDPTNCLLVFIPQWGRFTDYATGYNQYRLNLS